MPYREIRKVNVSDQIFTMMRDLIYEGEWGLNEKLPSETELSKRFGVSRATVRQALQKLSAIGLVETRVGDGSYVTEAKLSSQIQNILQPSFYQNVTSTEMILELRCVIEVETAGLAAKRATEENILRLREILMRQQDLRRRTVESFAADDLEFHMIIAKSTQNDAIVAVYRLLRSMLKKAMVETVYELGFDIGLPYHERLIEAIETRNEKAAILTMKEHMSNTKEQWERVFEHAE